MILPVGSSQNDLQLALKMLGSTEITPIPGTEGARDVVYSPDGEWIAYSVGPELFKRPLVGGSPVRLAEDAPPTTGVVGLAWLDDGTILYEQFGAEAALSTRRIAQISEDGGESLEVVFGLEEEVAIVWVHGLPGARGAFVVACPGTSCPVEQTQLHIVDLQDLSSEIAFDQVLRAWYAPTGHIVYVRSDGAVLAQPFDLAALELTGSSIPLFEGVRRSGPINSRLPDIVLGADGTLLYVEREGGAVGGLVTPVWVGRDGTAREIDPGWRVPGSPINSSLTVSPNEDRLAISIGDSEGTWDLWVKQLDTGPLSRLTFEGTGNRRATWSPDGQSLTFISNRAGQAGVEDLWTKRADGSGSTEVVLDRGTNVPEAFYSPDRTWLVFREGRGGVTVGDIFAIRPGGDSIAVPLVVTEFGERSPALSPDGRWLAYVSNEAGREEIYVRPFPDVDSGRWLVSADGGAEPVWAHSGLELFYRNGANELVAVQVSAGSSFAWDRQDVLFSMADFLPSDGHQMYDVSPDDQRFVMLRIGDDLAATGEPILVTNFFEELRQRMGN